MSNTIDSQRVIQWARNELNGVCMELDALSIDVFDSLYVEKDGKICNRADGSEVKVSKLSGVPMGRRETKIWLGQDYYHRIKEMQETARNCLTQLYSMDFIIEKGGNNDGPYTIS